MIVTMIDDILVFIADCDGEILVIIVTVMYYDGDILVINQRM